MGPPRTLWVLDVNATDLPQLTGPPVQVMVANCEWVASLGAYRASPFSIVDGTFVADFLELACAGYDMVLGM